MNPCHLAYNLVCSGAGAAAIPLLWLRARRDQKARSRFFQQLGRYPGSVRRRLKGRPRIWFHAVSVGEVGVAAAIAGHLRHRIPHCGIALSTGTIQGLARARSRFDSEVPCFFAPLDLMGPTRRVLRMVQPDVLAILETELWPNLIVTARRLGVRTTVLNGRISVRAINNYRHIKPLMRYVLSHVDVFSMISMADARRLRSIGADARRIVVNGNAKFDGPDPLAAARQTHDWAKALYGLAEGTPVFVAGSTRHPEERILLESFIRIRRKFPETVLILAPRHLERVPQIIQWVAEHGLTCRRRSTLDGNRPRGAPVVILDTIGELSATYSVASFVFCGGSLVSKGGQNVVEPALWEKPVMYGISMEDFEDARALIENGGGGFTVHGVDDMTALAIHWLRHPEQARQAGRGARRTLFSQRGAARKHAEVISRLLSHT